MESIEESLGRLARSGNLRVIPSDSSDDGLVDFTSNDYLGLAADRGLQDDFFRMVADRRPSLTASASRRVGDLLEGLDSIDEDIRHVDGRKDIREISGSLGHN